jgi:hypothetical protein
MIDNLTDLEPVLGQYDPGKVLVGPLLHLSMNSNFCFFYIAGNGPKIYESVSLGFVEDETDAQNRRTDIVATLESHFGEVKILHSGLEMAREAYALWPNEETTRFLATAALEAALPSTITVGRNESDQGSEVDELSSGGNPAGGEAARDADVIDPRETYLPLWTRNQGQPAAGAHPASTPRPVKLPDANATWPLNGAPAVTAQQRHSAREPDDMTPAVSGQVKNPDSGLEIVREADASCPNEEAIVRVLATAVLEAKLRATRTVGRDENCDQARDAGEPTSYSEPPEAEAQDPLAHADATDLGKTQPATVPPAWTSGPVQLPDAYANWPLKGGSAVPAQRRHSARDQDDIALAVLRLKSSMEAFAGTDANTTTFANTETIANIEPVAALPVKSTAPVRMVYRLCAMAGAAALVAGIIVLTITRQISKEGGSIPVVAPLIVAGSDTSQATAPAIPSIGPNQIANANDAAQQTPAASTVPPTPPSQAAETGRAQTHAAPLSGSSPASQAASTQSTGGPDDSPLQTPKAGRAPIGAPAVPGAQSPPASASNSQGAARAVTPSQAPEAARTQAEAAAVSGPQSPPSPAVRSQVAAAPEATPSQAPDESSPSLAVNSHAATGPEATPSQTLDAARGDAEAAVSGPPLPLSPTVNIQATTVPEATPSQAPDAPRAQAQMPSSQIANARVGAPSVLREPSTAKGSSSTPFSGDQLAALLSRSNDFLKDGDFAAARILLRRAAESGSADAALMLGKTFDPLYLSEVGAMGIQPDIEQCRQWYEKAAELGSEAAAQRLANLTQTGR